MPEFSKWEFTAKYLLAVSDLENMSIKDLLTLVLDSHKEAFETLWLSYTETYSTSELRNEISKTYDNCSAEDILYFSGGEEGIYIAMRILLKAGDHAIVIVPNFQAAKTLPLFTNPAR